MRDSSHAQIHRRLLKGIALAAFTMLAPACGSDGGGTPTTPVVTSVVGTWNLKTVNAISLPFTLQASDPKVEVLARQYVIASNGTFTFSSTLRNTELDGSSTSTRLTDSGSYVLADNFVAFTSGKDGTSVIASVTTTSMTIVAGTFTQVFTKE